MVNDFILLEQQIIYPKVFHLEECEKNETLKQEIIEILRFLELEKSIMEITFRNNQGNVLFLDLNVNWNDHLSVGEVQRLNLARIFYHKPELVFLDESTSALPEALENKIMNKLLQMNVTLVTCGHRPNLRRFHQMEMQIEDVAHWQMVQLKES